MSLRVLEPGLFSLVVDAGRPGHRSQGVPLGGAADRTSWRLGNALVGNPPDAAALEITLAGPTLQAAADLACVISGAPFEARVGDRRIEPGHTFNLRHEEVLRIGGTPSGSRGYLCVQGGLQAPVVLGSRSGLAAIKAGEVLPCLAGTISGRYLRLDWQWDAGRRFLQTEFGVPLPFTHLRVLPGNQADWFAADALAGSFKVTPASNRMGLRLQGEPLALPDRELVSEPVCPGSVQVTRDGQCIILGVDGQTIGGYPKVAQVIAADLDALGQLRPGDPIRFIPVDLAEAERLYRAKQAEVGEWLLRLRVAQP
jgi:biotin-dependent carboxylase-like uncharacterized protein